MHQATCTSNYTSSSHTHRPITNPKGLKFRCSRQAGSSTEASIRVAIGDNHDNTATLCDVIQPQVALCDGKG